MRFPKKWCAIVLSLLMLVQVAGVVAEASTADVPTIQSALDAGREVSYDAQLKWHSLPMAGEDVNGLLSSLLDALSVEGRFANTGDDEGYSVFSMNLNGQSALPYEQVTTADGVYINTPVMGAPMTVQADSTEDYFRNLGRYMDTMVAAQAQQSGTTVEDISYEEVFLDLYQQMLELSLMPEDETVDYTTMSPEDISEMLKASYAVYGLEDMVPAMESWTAEHMVPELYEGTIGSRFGVEADRAQVFEMDKADIIDMMETIMPLIADNETYWSFVLSVYNNMSSFDSSTYYEEITLDELMAEVPAAIDAVMEGLEQMPDDMIIRINLCYNGDESEEPVMIQVEVLVPAVDTEEYRSDAFVFYMEMLEEGIPMYMEFTFGEGDGLQLTVEGKDPLPGGVTDDGFVAEALFLEDGETMMTMLIQTTSVVAEKDNSRVWDADLVFSMNDGYEEYGVQFILNQVDTWEGEDIEKELTLDCNLIFDTSTLPMLTLTANIATGEAQGAPFEIDGTEFVNPGEMDDAAFAAYMDEVSTAAMQTFMRVFSMMPPEIFTLMMQTGA